MNSFPEFEVFIQKSHADAHVHVGSLIAPDEEVALQMARENFLRRDQAINIWVVRRHHILATPYQSDFLSREMDRSYREVGGYTENGRLWRLYKENEMTLEEIVAYVEGKQGKVKEDVDS